VVRCGFSVEVLIFHQSSVDTLNENDRDSLEALNTQWR
jgi:hypothetical protein